MAWTEAPTLLGLALRECRVRRAAFGVTLLAGSAAVALLVGALAAMQAYDRRTDAILREHAAATEAGLRQYDEDLERALGHLGFNLIVLPPGESLSEFYAEGVSGATMPEEFVQRLAQAGIVTARGFVPVLRRKVRWEERGWTVLVQAWGTPPGQTGDAAEAPPGSVEAGYELHRGLGLRPGDRVRFLGADFTVRACRPETGTRDDIGLYMNLREAQTLLGLPGRISEIRAVECRVAWNQLAAVRAEVARVLPGVTVVEESAKTRALAAAREAFETGQREILEQVRAARQSQRRLRARLALAVCGLALALAAGLCGALAWHNARERRVETAVWAALGVPPRRVYGILAWRGVLAAAGAAVLGVSAGWPWWGWPGAGCLAAWCGAGLAAALATVLPATAAAAALALRLDPADVLRNDV